MQTSTQSILQESVTFVCADGLENGSFDPIYASKGKILQRPEPYEQRIKARHCVSIIKPNRIPLIAETHLFCQKHPDKADQPARTLHLIQVYAY